MAWSFFLKPYQKQRIETFLNPSADAQGSGYNARQAMIAIGSGKFVGRGLGHGVQSHLRFLPEKHTDFMFASLCEELGFIGSSIVIGGYAGLCMFLIWVLRQTRSQEEALITIGVLSMLFFQTGVNIGMNLGILPVTGITLPLLSQGGSSILAVCISFGLIERIVLATHHDSPIEIR